MVRIAPQPSGEICDLRNELYEGVRKYVYAYGLRWGSRLPPGLACNPTRLSLASVGPTAPSTETRRRRVAPFTQKASADSVPPTFPFYPATTFGTFGVLLRVRLGQALALINAAPTPPICLSFVHLRLSLNRMRVHLSCSV